MDVQPPGAARRCILIVDDDPEYREKLCRLLAANGHAALGACNGRIARELLNERSIDLVLSDIFMPECDGFELIAAIRAMAEPVPVIAMSDREGWTGLNFLDAANDLGATAVIEKPFRAAVLLHLIAETLATAGRQSRVVPIGSQVARGPAHVPAGLEWVGGRSPAR